jgi:DNA-directed RNA polymerase specialized sigma24 family protein
MTYSTHRLTPDDKHSEALSYDRLEQPWRDWTRIARNFVYQLDDQWDREDLMHNTIVRLAEVAEEYRQKGKLLTKWGCIKVEQ